jgi:hypothetical protein
MTKTPQADHSTRTLHCPVALDHMAKTKAKQDEEDLKGRSGLARMMKTFQDETAATTTEAEAYSIASTNKDVDNRRSSLASWKQASDNRSLSSSFGSRLSYFGNSYDSMSFMHTSGGTSIGSGVKRLSSVALNMLGTSPKDAPSMVLDRSRRSSGTASFDIDSDDDEACSQEDTGTPHEASTKPPPRVSSIGKLLNGLWDEIINEEDTDDEDNDDNGSVEKTPHTATTAATSTAGKDGHDSGESTEEDQRRRWAELLEAGISHLDKEEYTQATVHFNKVLLLQREVLGTDHLTVAETLNYIGVALTHVDDSYAAMIALKEALWIREHRLEKDHEDILVTRRNLLRLYARSEEGLANARVDSSGQITTSESTGNNNDESTVVADDGGDGPLCF